MKHFKKLIFSIGILGVIISCHKGIIIPVVINITPTSDSNYFTVPANVKFVNNTTGADNFIWTFEGGIPASSTKKNPGTISFAIAGIHKITLEAWNDDDRKTTTITFMVDSAVQINFDTIVLINNFLPVTVKINNKTIGASTYSWSFEDGTPATSTLQQPPDILYTTAGDHNITLKASNGTQDFILTKKISTAPALLASFDFIPSFENQDYQAPFTTMLQNSSTSGLDWQWTSTGGVFNNPTNKNPQLTFLTAGSYTVTLAAANNKTTQTIVKTIVINPNTNLRTHLNIKFGINTATTTIGCYYSTKLGKVFKKGDNIDTIGKLIDIVFFGLKSSFSYNKFISPDSSNTYLLDSIPGAMPTKFINTQEQCYCGLNFTPIDFDNLINDTPLNALNMTITSGWQFFSDAVLPRVILFQTADGRKGAIKIKQFVNNGSSSYVLTDIKVQKI